ncbi:MAG: hypothetical protein PHW60_15840 [Kiritimatiellae bacterium]|nr:hypothetical protein [Kiritimatiellia bacterium]
MLVAALAVAAFIVAPAIQWDGAVFRQVNVIVQTGDGSPVSGAKVTFRDREYDWMMKETNAVAHMTPAELKKWQSEHYASGIADANGSFAFRAVFPAGGTRVLFWDNGRFTLRGTVIVEADGHKTIERPLWEYAGQKSLPVQSHRRKPIVIQCKLEGTNSHNNGADPTR